jgi:hypothetical protein
MCVCVCCCLLLSSSQNCSGDKVLVPREYSILQEVTASDRQQQSQLIHTNTNTNIDSVKEARTERETRTDRTHLCFVCTCLRCVLLSSADVVKVVTYHPMMRHPTASHVPHITAMVLPYYQVRAFTAYIRSTSPT